MNKKEDVHLVHEQKCSRCGIVKPRSEFGAYPRSASKLRYACRSCERAASRARYAKQVQSEGRTVGPRRPRRPLPEFAMATGWNLRKDIERLERIFADDRFTSYKQQVAAQVRGHLEYAAEVCQDLLSRLDHPTKG